MEHWAEMGEDSSSQFNMDFHLIIYVVDQLYVTGED